MRNTFRTGSMAIVRAEMIFLSDLTRPKSRMTRRARRIRTMPVGSLVMTVEMRLIVMMKVSSMFHAFLINGRNQ